MGSSFPKSLFEVKKHYLSEVNVKFNHKGNAGQLRAKLDEAKKADLRANHFEIGGPTADFKNTMSQNQFRPMTAKQRTDARPVLNQAKKSDLRASHWNVGQNSTPNLGLARGTRNTSSCKTMPSSNPYRPMVGTGKRPETAFVTSSMLNYKWVAPVPSLQ